MRTTSDWRKVKDELCHCGDLKSDHNGAMNHLDCKRCKCIRFTWKAFLDEKEVAKVKKERGK